MGEELRARIKTCRGRHNRAEFFDFLDDCGIPREMLPTRIGGETRIGIEGWIEHRRAVESEFTSS